MEVQVSEKMVDGYARLFHLRSSRNAKDAAMSKEAESAIFLVSMRTDGSSATTMLPARRPFVEQCDQVMCNSLACKVELGVVFLARHVY